MSNIGKQADFLHGIPIVANSAERDARFPFPDTGQRVHNLTTGAVERYTGTIWLPEIRSGSIGQFLDFDALGCAGDGSTDDSAVINSGISALSALGGGLLRAVPGKTYAVLSLALRSNVVLDLRGATLLKAGGGVGTTIIAPTGATTGSAYTLTADVTQNSTALSAASFSGLAVGDYVLLRDATYKYTTFGRNQEINRVASVSGGSLTLAVRALGSYATASGAEVLKLLPVDNAHILGGKLVIPTGTNNGGGLTGVLTVNCSVQETLITGPNDSAGVRWDQSLNPHTIGVKIRDGQNVASGGYGYGVQHGESTVGGKVHRLHTENMRENPVTNNARHITFSDCTDIGSWDNAFNTHGAGCEHVTFRRCISITTHASGFTCGFSTHNAGDTNILFDACEVYRAGAHGFASNAPVGKENLNVRFVDCSVDGAGLVTASSAGILIENTIGFQVRGGDISAANQANVSAALWLVTGQDGQVDGVKVRDVSNGWGIKYQGCTDVVIAEVKAKNISSSNLNDAGTNTNVRIRGVTADDTAFTFTSGSSGWLKALGVGTDRGDADVTLTAGDEVEQRFDTTLTLNRTVTLPTTAALPIGSRFRVTRTGLGAVTLTVRDAVPTTLKVIPSATAAFVDVVLTTTGWKLAAYGTL